MQNMLLQWIQKVDQFGSVFQPRILFNSTKHKTITGGMCTITLYSISLIYFLYGIVQWQNGQNLPTITSSQQTTISGNYTIKSLITSFQALTQVNPFNYQSMILVPVLTYNVGMEPGQFPQIIIPIGEDYNISNLWFFEGNDTTNIDYTILFLYCSEQILQRYNITNIQCANKSYQDSFWTSRLNRIDIGVEIQEFNIQSKQIQTVYKNFGALLQQNLTQYFQLYMRSSEVEVDDGILFPQTANYNFISDFTIISQTAGAEFFTSVTGAQVMLVIDLEYDNIFVQQSISYPKLNQILADIGSIVSIILFLSYIAIIVSESSLQNQICESIIQMYYPEMKEVKIKRNWLGKITSVENSPIEFKYFADYYKRLSKVAKQKLSVMNWIYELSRLQFIIQNLTSKDQQQLIHKYGIKLNSSIRQQIQVEKIRESQITPLHDFQLTTTKQKIIEIHDLDQSNDEIIEQKYNLCFENDDFNLLVHP